MGLFEDVGSFSELNEKTDFTLSWGALFKEGWPVNLRLRPRGGLSYLESIKKICCLVKKILKILVVVAWRYFYISYWYLLYDTIYNNLF